MPVRRRLRGLQVREVNPHVFLWGDGTWCFFAPPDPVHASREEAARAWGRCRRQVWGSAYRFQIPAAAEHYDGVTDEALDALRSGWHCTTFPLADVLGAIERDRVSLAEFARREPQAAKPIADYLNMRREDLEASERTARELAEYRRPQDRPYPSHLTSGKTYSGGEGSFA